MAWFRTGMDGYYEAQKVDISKSALAIFTSNSSGLYLPSAKAYITSQQEGSGTTSPTNVRAIIGRSQAQLTNTATNLCGGIDLANQIKRAIPTAVIDTEEKTVTFATNATASGGLVVLPFKEDTRYTIILTFEKTNTSGSLNAGFRWYYTDGNGGYTLEAPNYQTKTTQVATSKPNGTVLRINKINTGGVTKVYYEESGVFEGVLTADDFVPYEGKSYLSEFGQEVYGCTFDFATGELSITHELFQLTGSADENYILQGDGTTARRFRLENALSDYSSLEACSHDQIATNNNNIWGYARFVSSYLVLLDNNNTMADQTALKAWLANEHSNGRTVSFLMQLATPQVIKLPSHQIEQLFGRNNVFADTGDVEVKFNKIIRRNTI